MTIGGFFAAFYGIESAVVIVIAFWPSRKENITDPRVQEMREQIKKEGPHV